MQIQISWLLQKPTDLDLHCLQRQGISGFSSWRIKETYLSGYLLNVAIMIIICSECIYSLLWWFAQKRDINHGAKSFAFQNLSVEIGPYCIGPDKGLFSTETYWYFSYLSKRLFYGCSLEAPPHPPPPQAPQSLLISTHNICFQGQIRILLWVHPHPILSGAMLLDSAYDPYSKWPYVDLGLIHIANTMRTDIGRLPGIRR